MLLILVVGACSAPTHSGGDPTKPAPGGTEPEETVPDPEITEWEGLPEDEELPALLGAEQVAEAIRLGIEALYGRNLDDLDANIAATWERLDPNGGCPESFDRYSDADSSYESWWSGGCETRDAVAATGYAEHNTWTLVTDGKTEEGQAGYFEGLISTPEGHRAGGFGYYYNVSGRQDGQVYAGQYLIGELHGDADGTEGTWLADTTGFEMNAWAGWDNRTGGLWLGLSGSLPLVDAGDVVAFSVKGLEGYSEAWGYPCPGEYTGTYSVRDANGHWYDLDFDADDAEKPAGTCDGCADVLLEGEVIGLACPGLADLMTPGAFSW